jgi:signal peptidase II
MTPKIKLFTLWTLGLLALDQATKAATRATLAPYREEFSVIPDFFSIAHAQNKGAAGSILADFEHRLLFFFAFTAVAVAVLAWGLRHMRADDRLGATAVGILMSGVLGNLVDRVLFGQVTDMFKVYAGFEPLKSWAVETFGTYVYPIFNVADIAIWVGVGLYALGFLLQRDQELPKEDLGPPIDLDA